MYIGSQLLVKLNIAQSNRIRIKVRYIINSKYKGKETKRKKGEKLLIHARFGQSLKSLLGLFLNVFRILWFFTTCGMR